MRKLSAAVLLLALSPWTVTCAQDGLKPLDEDAGGWLGEEEMTPPPADQADPLSGPSTPSAAPEAAAPKPAELTPEERRRRDKQINRNYDKAQEIYQGIINSDKLQPLERRIANNERIIREYNGKIRQGLAQRRELQVQVFNQSFYLKQQLDRGQISQDVYDRMILKEEQKYEQQVADLKKSVGLWRAEVKTAKARLAELKAQHRMVMASRPKLRKRRKAAKKPKPRPGHKLMTSLQGQLRQLNAFRTKHTLEGTHPRELGSPMIVGAPATDGDDGGLDGGEGSLETPPEEEDGFWDD
jgi:hypothetical protein